MDEFELISEPDDEHGPYDADVCEGCGKADGCCPLCCARSYAPGSEQCDWCKYRDECRKLDQGGDGV